MFFRSPSSLLVISILLISSLAIANGAKILFMLGLSSHSHRVAIQPLATALSEKGHDVTFFSPIKPEVPNPKIKEFCPQALKDANEKMAEDTTSAAALKRVEDRHYDPFFEGNMAWDLMLMAQVATIKSPEFSEWVNSSHFDLIIYDHPAKEYVFLMAMKMKAKVIAFCPMSTVLPSDNEIFGFPVETWADAMESNPYWFLPDRYFATLSLLSWYFSFRDYYLPKAEAINREVFSFDYPPFEQLLKSVDLIFLNDHVSAGYPKTNPPLVVPVGGMHVKESNGTLPKDIETFLAGADRFVYISFGSIIRVSKLPLKMRKVLFDAVASISGTKFLWKWEGDIPDDLPKNALAKNWFPQQDVLANPKCKGFVTQGGLMSLQQSVFHGVPVLVVPGFGDQPYNARMVVNMGIGMHLELADINIESFSSTIRQLYETDKYASKMKQASRQFRDRPLSALDTAVWWTEYVLRHDTSHLKSGAMGQTWWQNRSLDLWLILFLLATFLANVSILVIWKGAKLILEISSPGKVKQS